MLLIFTRMCVANEVMRSSTRRRDSCISFYEQIKKGRQKKEQVWRVKWWQKQGGDKGAIVLCRAVPGKESLKKKSSTSHSPCAIVSGGECSHAWQMSCPLFPSSPLSASQFCVPRDTPLKCETLHAAATLPESMWRHKWVSISLCVWYVNKGSFSNRRIVGCQKLVQLLTTSPTVLSLKHTSMHRKHQWAHFHTFTHASPKWRHQPKHTKSIAWLKSFFIWCVFFLFFLMHDNIRVKWLWM